MLSSALRPKSLPLLSAVLLAGWVLSACQRNPVLPLAVPLDPPSSAGIDSGTYREAFTLSLEAPQPDALVRYNLDSDASVDDRDAWTDYTVPIPIDRSTVVRTYAYVLEANPSPVRKVDLELKVPDPVPDVAAGPSALAALDVEFSCSLAGAVIRYTTDGTVPTPSSAIFTSGTPISFVVDTVVRAVGFYPGWTASDVGGGFYDLLNGGNFTIILQLPDGTITPSGNNPTLEWEPLVLDSMNVMAAPAGITGPFVYRWFLNGALIPGATTSSLTVSAGGFPGGLGEGSYTLTMEATAGGYSYSETVAFQVVDNL